MLLLSVGGALTWTRHASAQHHRVYFTPKVEDIRLQRYTLNNPPASYSVNPIKSNINQILFFISEGFATKRKSV